MKKITSEQYRELDVKLCDLQYRLDCLEQMKSEMSYEDYLRERSFITYKMECHEARMEGRWNNVPTTYKSDGYEQY